MHFSDWMVSLLLVLLVVRQVRGRRLSVAGLLWPVALVGWAGYEYLGDVPRHRSDWVFVVMLAAVGLALGIGCGLLTSVYAGEESSWLEPAARQQPCGWPGWQAGWCSASSPFTAAGWRSRTSADGLSSMLLRRGRRLCS